MNRSYTFALALSFSLINNAQANDWYWGYGILTSDFSDFTLEDSEATSLTMSKHDQEPLGFSVFAGKAISPNVNFELGFESYGEQHSIGSLSGASIDSKTRTYAVYPSLVLKPSQSFSGITPFARFGFGLGWSESTSTKTNAVGVFSNPNNESQNEIGAHLIYGLGASYQYSDNTAIRLEWKVNKDAQTDYINNIDNGYIERDFTNIGLQLVHNYDGKATASNDSPYSIGVFYGSSTTDARMSGGSYSGNIYNLTTNSVRTTVSGAMTDDKTDASKRIVAFYPINKDLELELHAANYGVFKSRSSNLGITGGGNALTGAATRTATSINAQVAFPIELTERFEISPSVGVGLFYTEDEMYNNLEFDGVGGSDRGPQSTSTNLNPVAGLMGRLKLTNSFDVALRYDYAHDVGHSSGMGKGNLSTVSIGLISKF